MEGSDDVLPNGSQACSREDGREEDISKSEDGGHPLSGDLCDGGMVGLNKGDGPTPSLVTPPTEPPGGLALKVSTTVLHPVCLGDAPLMLPIHLQMGGAPGSQLGPMGTAPYLIASQSPVSLPMVLDQQVLQHMSPSVLPQTAACSTLQNGVLCQNPLTFSLPPAIDPKGVGAGPAPVQDANLLSLLQNPAFATILQDLFPPQAGPSTCQSPGSAFLPFPPLVPPYTSPLAPLVPPATLLVPYPIIIPLPVPLPIPLPVPVPVPQAEDSKVSPPKPVSTVSRSTQTPATDITPTSSSHRKCLLPFQAQSPSSLLQGEGQVLDLSVRPGIVELKQECPSPQQDGVLDLSVPGVRKLSDQRAGQESGQDPTSAALALGVGCAPSLDSKLIGRLTSLEFSRQHKWLVDTSVSGSGSLGQETSVGGGGNLEIVSTSQTAKVIVSVKDAIPAILCGKIKGLSGVSTKNFSIKRDGSQAASLQQLYSMPSASHDHHHPHKKASKNRAIKLKKVSSQEIHFLPIKKQRLTALLPRK